MNERFVVKKKNSKVYLSTSPGLCGRTWTTERAKATPYKGESGHEIARTHARCYDGVVCRLTPKEAKAKAA